MAILPNGRRRVSREAQGLNYYDTGLDDGQVNQEVAQEDPVANGPATDFEGLQQSLQQPAEKPEVPDMSGLNATQPSMEDGGLSNNNEISAFRNELIDALSQVNVDPERARLVAKKALTIGYKNPQEDILAGEFLVPAKDDVPITQVKSVFAPIVEKHGFLLTSLKPHQSSGKSGKKMVDYWKLEFETKTQDPNEQQVEGDYADLLEQSDLGNESRPIAALSQHSFIRNARSQLLESVIAELAKKRGNK